MQLATLIVKGGHLDGTHEIEFEGRIAVDESDEASRLFTLFAISKAGPGATVKGISDYTVEMMNELGADTAFRLGHHAHEYKLISDKTDVNGHRWMHVEYVGIVVAKGRRNPPAPEGQ